MTADFNFKYFVTNLFRTLDPVLSSSELASVLQDLDDNIPLILALVNEAAEVFVLSSDLKPLPSLFG